MVLSGFAYIRQPMIRAGVFMRSRFFLRVLLAVILLAAMGSFFPACAGEGATAHVPLFALRPDHLPMIASVSVGGGPSSPVSLDTGSAGLYVPERDIGPGTVSTGEVVHQGYADGTRLEGYVALATVRFTDADRTLSTSAPIRVGVITRVYCAQDRPNCPGSINKPGVMGISLATRRHVVSPLAQMGPYSTGYIIDSRLGHDPVLTVGLTENNIRGFTFAALRSFQSGPDHLPSWDGESVSACFAIDGIRVGCQETVFDSGSTVTLFSPGSSDIPLTRHHRLPPDHVFVIDVPDVLHFAVRTDRTTIIVPKDVEHANSGMLLYRYFAIAFDSLRGRVGFFGHQENR
ncbi:Hypothetical protein GbCGDNIH4_0588 [Granulibacter bethesdensis CGDNIH4]|nr:Hypothetical protein GbCGDNIH4_0588 [Granulibacter bethesdensis CGDNIH4]